MPRLFDSTDSATGSDRLTALRLALRAARAAPAVPVQRALRAPVAALLVLCSGPWGQPLALAQGQAGPSSSGIYSCTDDRGRRLSSDRPIPECLNREQRVLNRDGSLKTVRPPTLTAEERAQNEAREREAAQAKAAREEAIRRDRQLLQRYRTEAQHQRARTSALETVRQAQERTEQRLAELARERRALDEEAAFYKGKPWPLKLKALSDANEAALAAQKDAAAGQRDEAERLNRRFDAELARLKRLWAGAAPGSLGPLETVYPAASAPTP